MNAGQKKAVVIGVGAAAPLGALLTYMVAGWEAVLAIGTALIACVTVIAWVQTLVNAEKLDNLGARLNGRVDQLIEAERERARAEAAHAQAERQKKESE